VSSCEPGEILTFLFTDIEGSSRLWEEQPGRMQRALALHDRILRSAVERNSGAVLKSTGDGVHAIFRDPRDAVATVIEIQRALADPVSTDGLPLRVRCGMHAGASEARDGDRFGSPVNLAARIMSAAHGGQVLASQAVVGLIRDRLPDGVSLRDLGTVRLRDISRPEHIFQVAHAALRQEFPALRSLELTPNNLPHQVTSFVGREPELDEIRKLLTSNRLVTLLGAGGIGKSRLSLQAASSLIDDYPDGVWLVRFAAIADPHFVSQTVASVLGVKEDADTPLSEALVKYCRDRRSLLIFDNCEHLVQACAELATTVLQSGPHISILTTSREPLHMPGERTYQVPSLALPDARAATTPELLARYESVGLFVDRATAAHSSFLLTPGNAAAVADICMCLDGIPLALELAAARVRAMSVETIAARLTDRFRLLTKGDRTALPRHQTLRALIDWSYDLLTPTERVLLRRLAVFADGWTVESAEAVGAGSEIEPSDVLEILTALVEKSLVVAAADGTRYRLLQTVRAYAEERLQESGESDTTRMRHLAFYLALAEGARAALTGPEQGMWFSRLDLDRENLLAAHAYCDRDENNAQLGLRLVYAVQPYLLRRGVMELAHRVLAEALARPGAEVHNLVRCKALFAAGWQTYYMGRYEDAARYLEDSLSIAREIDDKVIVAVILQPLGMAALGQGMAAKAREYLEEALVLARENGNAHQIAAALNALGQLARLEGRLDQAEPLYKDVLALARNEGNRESIAFALLNLAMASIGRGRVESARPMLLEALAIADEIGSMPTGQSVLEVSSGLGALSKDWERAAVFFGAADAQAARTGLRRDPADEAFLAPLVANAQAALGLAAFSAAAAAGRALTYEAAMTKVRAWLETVSLPGNVGTAANS
jgi:predicted ATPase/class 3 adenylate cyclase